MGHLDFFYLVSAAVSVATLPTQKSAFLKEQLLKPLSDVFIPQRRSLKKQAKKCQQSILPNLVIAHKAFLDPTLVRSKSVVEEDLRAH